MNIEPEPWSPANATEYIREMAQSPFLQLAYKLHAARREYDRSISNLDVLHVLKTGFVRREPIKAKTKGYFRYVVEGRTPNSGSREAGVVLIPNFNSCSIKILTVMWVDEDSARDGTI